MGQSNDKIMSLITSQVKLPRVTTEPPKSTIDYDDIDNENGLMICNNFIPEEVVTEILCLLDPKSLLKCQLVCKKWKFMIQNYIWRKKVEIMLNQALPLDVRNDIPWWAYYKVCLKRPFHRNLIKNHSGKKGVGKHWKVISQGGDHWKVENPPCGVPPLPPDPVFKGEQYCFVSSYGDCCKEQIIDFAAEGLTPEFLDILQPPIIVSEWYCCRWDCPALYHCAARLIGEDNKVLDGFHFRERLIDDKQNKWFKVTHEFKNYGKGVRKLAFYHFGRDRSFWAGHYGSKMAGASVRLLISSNSTGPNTESTSKQAFESSSEDSVDLSDMVGDYAEEN